MQTDGIILVQIDQLVVMRQGYRLGQQDAIVRICCFHPNALLSIGRPQRHYIRGVVGGGNTAGEGGGGGRGGQQAHRMMSAPYSVPSSSMVNIVSSLVPHSGIRQLFAEPVLLNVYGAPALIPRNEFRQPMQPGGTVRKPYSSSVPSPHRLFKNYSSAEYFCWRRQYAP